MEGLTDAMSTTDTTSIATTGKELTEFKDLSISMAADHSASGSSTIVAGNQKPSSAKWSFAVCQNIKDYPPWHPVQKKLNLELYNTLQDSNIQKFKEH